VPDLATSWTWSEDATKPTFPLRQGVKWHEGKPFTAKDVECTWNLLMETSVAALRVNPRFFWYRNVDHVTTSGGGSSPIHPCHVPPDTMRKHPIGTGPFKFVEYKPDQHIKVARNPGRYVTCHV
jgi:peptide/nickel transport system substrate-binding protein